MSGALRRSAARAVGRFGSPWQQWQSPPAWVSWAVFAPTSAARDDGVHPYGNLQRGMATGQHPLYELDKIKRTAEGHIDITDEEPGTGDMPHMRGPMLDMVEEEFREPPREDGSPKEGVPDFFIGDTPPEHSRSPPPGSGAATTSAEVASSISSGPHENTNQEGGYGGPGQDYYHGTIPVVTDPVSGMATGSVVNADKAAREELGAAVIRGRSEERVGVHTQKSGTLVDVD
ncbi:hypothetical protein GPECTOR_2g1428 [Gonium pectorale]|uniref:Uncharacterized protein n=1 Tax=Gonium pectorale TaxID=33097 RepID=A0A150H146_GONPE|nr:hypothetical protein GPECTOR_2g1428 [Gonium pectorale]|eukprot:KXZ55877.1 hypothetical protein GPECTOR_2g1428 [Gonium pectorale]